MTLIREKIETMQAFELGEEIEVDKERCGIWVQTNNPLWDWNNNDYRIKPKSKQTVTIEKWLCKDDDSYLIIESDSSFQQSHDYVKIKLLDTCEIEL